MKIAIMDIGSNSVRLMMLSDGKILYKDLNTCRLGEKIAYNGYLLPQAMERGIAAISDFSRRAKEEGAEQIYAFATAAVRSASNGSDFVRAVRERCGIEIDVIDGNEEAEIGLTGALGLKDGAILDVGGASSELIIRKNGKVIFERSCNVGAVRLFDLCERDFDLLNERIEREISAYGEVRCDLPLYGIGGTATSLACVYLGLKTYDPVAVNGCRISLSELKNLAVKLLTAPVEEICRQTCIGEKRAEIIGGGALLIYHIMKKTEVSFLIVNESDNLEGYAMKKGIL